MNARTHVCRYLQACIDNPGPVKAKKASLSSRFTTTLRRGGGGSAAKSPAKAGGGASTTATGSAGFVSPRSAGGEAAVVTQRFTGAKMKQKGVLVELCINAVTSVKTPATAVKDSQLKHIMFDIASTGAGLFRMSVQAPGVQE